MKKKRLAKQACSDPPGCTGDGGEHSSKRMRCEEAKDGLAWVLGDAMTVEDFRKRHFEREPLHVKRSSEGGKYYTQFSDLSTPEGFFKMLDSGEVAVDRANVYRCVDGSNKETPPIPPRTAADVRRLFKEGWSIQWLQPQQENDSLARMVAILESEFGSLVGVNAYLTPPGVQGLAPHYDDVEVFVLQLHGRKSWHLHNSTTASPVPPEAQTLPRFCSGDLPLESLAPIAMKPQLEAGDFLYFPRGTIHYAPNQDKGLPSVHLTISTYQRQTLYDLASKTFEEAMSELWESEEDIRRGVPWETLFSGSKSYPSLSSSVAQLFRRVADAVDTEAKAATSAVGGIADASGHGPVAGATSDLCSEFVSSRMPPLLIGAGTGGDGEDESCTIVSPATRVAVVDPSAFALVPLPGDNEGMVKLVHCLHNARKNHMMGARPGANGPANNEDGAGDEEDEEEEEESEDKQNSDDDGGIDDDDSENGDGLGVLSKHSASVLRVLCRKSPCLPLALKQNDKLTGGDVLKAVLLEVGAPKRSWDEVCGLMTRLAAMGLVHAISAGNDDDDDAGSKKVANKKKGKMFKKKA